MGTMENAITTKQANSISNLYKMLIDDFFGGRKATTRKSYQADIKHFAAFVGASTAEEAAFKLIGKGDTNANAVVLRYKVAMVEDGLSSATVARRLSALKALAKLAALTGCTRCNITVRSPKVVTYRDTRGPSRSDMRSMLEGANGDSPKAKRDAALIRLLYDMALRSCEVLGLDVSDVDLAGGVLHILGKGRTDKERLTIPAPTKKALAAWLDARGNHQGPVFTNFDHRGAPSRLTARSLQRIIKEHGAKIGIKARPHGLRHSAITTALDQTNGDFRRVQAFSRHADPKVINRYDDNRMDLGGAVAASVAMFV